MAKKTLYCLIDTETTKKNGLVFDCAYEIFDRTGRTFEKRSVLFKDVLAIEEPFYKEKIAHYWTLAFKGYVKPMTIMGFRRHFNHILHKYISKGFKVIICAYNAAFDVTHLGQTCDEIGRTKILSSVNKNVQFLDIWHAWCAICPVEYGYTAPLTPAGNIKTTAEDVYRYLANDSTFIERHVANFDVTIEKLILLHILRQKKKLHIVSKPSDFVAMPWKIAAQRCRTPIEFRLAKQKSMESLIKEIPATTETRLERQGTIIFPGDEQRGS